MQCLKQLYKPFQQLPAPARQFFVCMFCQETNLADKMSHAVLNRRIAEPGEFAIGLRFLRETLRTVFLGFTMSLDGGLEELIIALLILLVSSLWHRELSVNPGRAKSYDFGPEAAHNPEVIKASFYRHLGVIFCKFASWLT